MTAPVNARSFLQELADTRGVRVRMKLLASDISLYCNSDAMLQDWHLRKLRNLMHNLEHADEDPVLRIIALTSIGTWINTCNAK